MLRTTDTLKVGSVAPDFSLSAANREERFSLSDLRTRGPVIVEFLRGTW
jgi:peroxiredoxin